MLSRKLSAMHSRNTKLSTEFMMAAKERDVADLHKLLTHFVLKVIQQYMHNM